MVGDFFVSKAFEVTEHNDLAAAVWQRAHGVGEHFEFVALVDLLSRSGPVFQNREFDQIRHGLGRLRAAAAEEIEGDIARGGEEKRLRITHAAGGLGTASASTSNS